MRPEARAPAALVLAAAVVLAVGALTFLALRGPSKPATLQERAHAVGETLRCPVCQDLSVADSPSAIAREIRQDIARRLAAGQSPSAIRAYYVGRYGPWILMSPPKSGATLAAWLLPVILVAGGGLAAGAAVRRWTRRRSNAPDLAGGPVDADGLPVADGLSAADRRLLERALGLERSE